MHRSFFHRFAPEFTIFLKHLVTEATYPIEVTGLRPFPVINAKAAYLTDPNNWSHRLNHATLISLTSTLRIDSPTTSNAIRSLL